MDTKKLLGEVAVPPELEREALSRVKTVADVAGEIRRHAADDITRFFDAMMASAVALNVSDVHIEPQQSGARLRLRLDGLLHDAAALSQEEYHHLLSRIKLESKLKLNITDKPQDGRFTLGFSGSPIEVRTSALPAEHGESIVMRLLNPKNLLSLESLGLRKDLYQTFAEAITRPNGMIVVTGPTGAGKTTTLYAFLQKLQSPEVKIITIEDPIEYRIKGISQTQTAPEKGYGFADGLRFIVRQDPDVILVGEIRDQETALIALQASLTGQLVLSTLHTNDAAGTIPRLIDLGAKPSSIAPALKMAVAQRLVRKVCRYCAKPEKPSAGQLKEMKTELARVSAEITNVKSFADATILKATAKGCPECNFTGYRGRRGLYEAFTVNEDMERFILENPAAPSIRQKLKKEGMITLRQAGLIEVLRHETTMEELDRVVKAEE